MTDPRKRPDGRCALKGCTAQAHPQDPFCSAVHCREWHDNPIETRSIWQVNHGQKSVRIRRSDTDYKREHRKKFKTPCQDCGAPVSRYRKTRPGADPNRPYLCITCINARRRIIA